MTHVYGKRPTFAHQEVAPAEVGARPPGCLDAPTHLPAGSCLGWQWRLSFDERDGSGARMDRQALQRTVLREGSA